MGKLKFMHDKINSIIGEHFARINIEEYNWDCYFGYDCIEISLNIEWGLSTSVITSLEKKLKTELSWINIKDNNLIIGFDISNMIIEEFGTWEEYEPYYNFYEIIS